MFNKRTTLPLIYLSFTLLLFLSLLNLITSETTQRLSTMNILLPVCTKSSCKPVYATVKAEGGCFGWKVENENLVNLRPVSTPSDKPGCVHKVEVFPKTNQVDTITWLIATDKQFDEQFKCKIGFAEVDKIEISTRFDTNNIGDLFELQVEAKDSKGNIFSSLEGWSFNWIIENLDIVELRKSIDENKKVSAIRKEIEKNNYSDIILVKGKSVGQITVKCQITEKDLNKVSPIKNLYIVDPFSISPDVIYIMPKSTIDLHIKYLSGTMVTSKQMQHYTWSIEDAECGSISSNGVFTSKDIICKTEIIVKDNRITDNNTAKAIVYVVYPDQIRIGYIAIGSPLAPSTMKKNEICSKYDLDYEKMNQAHKIFLIAGHEYFIKYFIFYQSNAVFYSKDIFKFNKTEYPRQVEMDYCDNYNNPGILRPKIALTEEESIKAVLHLGDNQSLSEEKKLMIHSQVTIKKFGMQYFTLPYLGFSNEISSSSKYNQELSLKVTGGSNHYKFNTTHNEVIKVSNNTLLGNKTGASIITVFDEENNDNFDNIEVRVSEIRDMTYLEQRQEIKVNSEFDIAVIGVHNEESKVNRKDPIGNYINTIFTNCTKMFFNAQIEQQQLIEQNTPTEKASNNNMANIKNYMEQNSMLFDTIERLYDIKTSSSAVKGDLNHKEYLEFANYGICDISLFKAKSQGIGYISYKVNNDQIKNPITSNTKASISIYKEMSLKHDKYDEYTETIMRQNNVDDPYLKGNISLVQSKKSNFAFEIENGLNRWNDITHEMKPIPDKNKVTLNNKKGDITCNKNNYMTTVDIQFQAKESLILPRPALSKLQLNINCQSIPKSISIFFLSNIHEGNNMTQIYRIPQEEITYHFGYNTTEIVRVYGFDENNNMILNFVDNNANIKSNVKPKVYELISQEDFKKYSSQLIPKDSSEFFQTYALFNDINKSKLIYQSNTDYTSTHTAILVVIELPRLEPNTGTIYVSEDNSFEFSIINGSGDYDIALSDNRLASYHIDHSNNKLMIKPKEKGVLSITLIDKTIKGNPSARATLYLADVKEIKLIGGGLLMMNRTLTIKVKVIDTFDNQFSIEQLNKIPLNIDESYDKTIGLSISYSNPNYRTIGSSFTVTGIASGTYPITVILSRVQVQSNTITVEVFDKLNVFPPKLLLIPGSNYTLSITGGPRNSEKLSKKFSIDNTKIASIADDIPEVFAHYKGETILRIELIYNYDYDKIYNDDDKDKDIINKTESLCVETVPVRVEIPTDIKIIGASERQVFTQSTIRLLTAFKFNNETFTYGIGKMQFRWEVENKESGHIITFAKNQLEDRPCDNQYDETCVLRMESKDHENDSIGIFFQNEREGIIKILLNVTITYPDYYKNERSVFNTAENVKVNDQVYVDINEFYGQNLMKSTIYMIPFNVDHELHTSKKTIQRYTIESTSSSDANSIISLTEAGRITTNYNTGRVYVKITNNEKDKNMLPVLLPIFVTDFYSLFVEKTNILRNLEIGQEINLSVILQHDSGKLFAEIFERLQVKVVESHPKIVKADLINHSSKLKLKALSQGQTHIILFHPESRKIYDVFKITVSNSLHLGNSFGLHAGGTIHFMGNDKKKLEEATVNSIWSSNDTSVLTIEPKTGLATGKSEGVASVQLKTNDGIIKKIINVNVGKIRSIYIDKTKLPTHLTNIISKPNESSDKVEYVIPVDFYTSTSDTKLLFKDPLNIYEQNIILKCQSNTPSIVRAFQRKSNDNSQYECVISMNSDINQLKSIPSEIEIKFSVHSKGDKELYSTIERFPFISSFSIKNKLKGITIASKGKLQKIDIIGNMINLQAFSQDNSLVRIENVNVENKCIEVIVPDSVQGPFHNVPITIKNTVTNQEEVVNASFGTVSDNRAKFLGLIPMDTIVDTITLILLIVIIVILIIYLSSPKEQARPMQGTTAYSNRGYQGPKGSGLRSNDYNSNNKVY